jgi:hypothetical protein
MNDDFLAEIERENGPEVRRLCDGLRQAIIEAVTSMDQTTLPKELWEQVQPKLSDGETSKKALEIFRKASERVLTRLKQTIAADVADGMKTTLIAEVNKLSARLQEMCGNWINEAENITIYPEGTRFFNRHEHHQALLIEQKPQVRTLTFANNLMENQEGSTGIRRYGLALPYVVFFIEFNQSLFYSLRVGYRNQPIKSAEDKICVSNLPNIANLSVCMGNEWKQDKLRGGSIAQQATAVINHFWQSTFNRDQRQDFDYYRQYAQLSTLHTWEQNSQLDPSFILHIPWKEQCSVAELIRAMKGANKNVATQLQAEVQNISKAITDKVNTALSCVEMGKISPGELTSEFSVILQGLLTECYGLTWKYCSNKLTNDRRQMEKELDEIVKEELNQLLYFGSKPW